MAGSPVTHSITAAIEGFGSKAFDYLFTQLTFSSAARRWGEAVFGEYEGQTSHTLASHVDMLVEAADITSASRVLELGSGTGGFGCYVAGRTGCNLRGVDWSQVGVRLANKQASAKGLAAKVRFLLGDFRNLKLPNNSYDVVFAIDALHFDTDLKQLSSNIARVLREGGRFVTLMTVRTGTTSDAAEAVPGLSTVADVTAAFACAGLHGRVFADLTASYIVLATRMLRLWKEDSLNLQRELGTPLFETRISEDSRLLNLLHSGALRRVLFITYRD